MLLWLARAAQDRGWKRVSRFLFRLDLAVDGLGGTFEPSSAHSGGRRQPATRNPGAAEDDAALIVGDGPWAPAGVYARAGLWPDPGAGVSGEEDGYGLRLMNEGRS